MGSSWVGGNHDEDSDDRLLDEMGRVHKQGPPRKPPNRSCALVLVAGAGGLAGIAVVVAEAAGLLT